MPSQLTAEFILKAAPGVHRLRRRLYMQVRADCCWFFFRYMRDGRSHDVGLGAAFRPGDAGSHYPDRKLAASNHLRAILREAGELDQQLLEGTDPAATKDRMKVATKAAEAKRITFRQCAEQYIEANKAAWRSAVHIRQWPTSLETYVYPAIGSLPVANIEPGMVTKLLQPIWTTKPETASRVRGRIEAVLDYATAHGWRTGENPARWKGHLAHVFPRTSKVRRVKHHAALDHALVPEFYRQLCEQSSIAALARTVATRSPTWPCWPCCDAWAGVI
jgi:hypothetical protein